MKFLSTTFRYLTRDKVFSLINILGLTIGLTAILFIGAFIGQEASYDDFHEKGKDLYRFSTTMTENGRYLGEDYIMVPPVGPTMKSRLPEVEEYTRISYPTTYYLSYNNEFFKTDLASFADTSFFNMFSFDLLEGDKSTVLGVPYSIVLTKSLAKKIFGDENPIGKLIVLNGSDQYTITGLAQDPPKNSAIQFEALMSFSTLYRMPDRHMGWNGGNQYITYIQLFPHADREVVHTKINEIMWEYLGQMYKQIGIDLTAHLRPMKNLHLHYSYESKYLKIVLIVLSSIAMLILLVAGINFVNLTTARSLKRIKEAGVRKILGAKKKNLVQQFLGESLLVCLIAFVFAFICFKLLEPFYNFLSNSKLVYTNLTFIVFAGVFLLTIGIGIIAGSYPAFKLSRIPLVDAAKGGGEQKRGEQITQSVLIVLQLVISVVLIICTLIVSKQLNYVKKADAGLKRTGILVIETIGKPEREKLPLLKERLQQFSDISVISASSTAPVDGLTRNGYLPEGYENVIMMHFLAADEDFLDVYDIQLKSGRFFSENRETDKESYVINESAAKLFEDENDVLGKWIQRDGKYPVIGVVNNFNFSSMYNEIAPLVIGYKDWDNLFRSLSVRYNTGDISGLIQKIEKEWYQINPHSPFNYYFFDEKYEQQYKMEMYFQRFFLAFALVAIVLAVLGMLSLMAYTTEQRKKEIGVRKVMGASIPDILKLLLRKTSWLVLIANLIAWPIAWYAAQQWLKNFAYRADIGWLIFAIALLSSAFIALLSVGLQAYRAAVLNPVESIKTE